jgi:hypothetical protein
MERTARSAGIGKRRYEQAGPAEDQARLEVMPGMGKSSKLDMRCTHDIKPNETIIGRS